jgi:hypothetical protein
MAAVTETAPATEVGPAPAGRSPHAWLATCLWVSVVSWGVGLGAKLFELVVVIGAWAATPPASLALMPYGPSYPRNPGDFFQPLSVATLAGTVGALAAGWRTPADYRLWLWMPLVSLLVIWAATPTLFWPLIAELYAAGTGARLLSPAEADALVTRWLVLDWLRAALIAVGFVCAVQALSVRPRGEST